MSFRERNRRIVRSLRGASPQAIVPYELSLANRENAYFILARRGLEKILVIIPAGRRSERVTRLFEGESGPEVTMGRKTARTLVCETSHKNAVALRATLANLRPRPLGLTSAFGMGDRLGLATPGHATAARRYAVLPVLAQQSIREMTRTGRSPENVIDDATWGAFQVGHVGIYGADADHLKTADDVTRCAAAGFTMFTIDPGEYVSNDADSLAPDALRARFHALTDCQTFKDAFLGKSFDFPETRLTVRFDEESLARSAVKYAGAIEHVERLARRLEETYQGDAFDLEVSVDETDSPTSAGDHVFVAGELRRRGIVFTGIAPRFVGEFEKAIDYSGDLGMFRREFAKHAAIARALGPYKISIHSGSDKFSIYPVVGDLAGDLLHVKTAGTSYLEAVRLIARCNGDLYRRIHALALKRFANDRASYHLTTDLAVIPPLDSLGQDELETLLDERNVRQLIHVTYGSALNADDGKLKDEMFQTLAQHEEEHYALVERHMGKHIELLGMGSAP